ncbi:uncharacterized protein [Chlorocebus sabaeus]|uniref:uncharacterized protein isoform X2 n=1 Tax=Chlorocebus sabaeus TaxID=60711 RepID=UPI003BF9EB77
MWSCGARKGLSSLRRLSRGHAHHRAWRWNSNWACERALQYQLGDKIHGFTINQDRDKDVHTCSADFHSLAMRAFSLTGHPCKPQSWEMLPLEKPSRSGSAWICKRPLWPQGDLLCRAALDSALQYCP